MTDADENKSGRGNFPGKNEKQVMKQGETLNSGIENFSLPLRYHRLAAYNFLNHSQKYILCDYPITLKLNIGGKGGCGNEKRIPQYNIAFIL